MTTSCVVCGVRIASGARCAAHAWRGEYRTADYRRNREAALLRDNGACVLCGRGPATGDRVEVDHVVAIIDGGRSDLENLATLCRTCHAAKTRAARLGRLAE